MRIPIKGKVNCIEFITSQKWHEDVIKERIEEFSNGTYDAIEFDKDGTFWFTKTEREKQLYAIEEYRIWAYSEKEALKYLEQIKKF